MLSDMTGEPKSTLYNGIKKKILTVDVLEKVALELDIPIIELFGLKITGSTGKIDAVYSKRIQNIKRKGAELKKLAAELQQEIEHLTK